MARFHARRRQLDRRHLLKGAGAAIALPLLEAMRPARGPLPARSVFVYLPNGANMLDWQVETAGPGYELGQGLAPLERHREHLTPISGLHHPSGLGRSHEVERIWLTGADLTPATGYFRNGVSADQLMAEVAGEHTRFPSLEIAVTEGSLAWSRGGVRLPAERKPAVIFERLFGAKPGGLEAARRRLERRASVLDAVLAEARCTRRSLGHADRGKLDEYLDAVREVELRTERAGAWLEVPRPEVEPERAARLTREIPDADAGDYYDTIYELIALALATDVTRVVTCMLGSEGLTFALPELGIPHTRHELSHHNDDPQTLARLTRADRFLSERLAGFLDRLRSLEEEEGTLLDRTQVLYGSGMAYGHGHGNANLPTLLAGGRALGLRHGRHLDFNLPRIGRYDLGDHGAYYGLCLKPADPEARLADLLLTMLRCAGVETEEFAGSRRVLTELLA